MKDDYIKLSSKAVEARGRYVPHAIGSYLALRALDWAMRLTLALALGGSLMGLAQRAFAADPAGILHPAGRPSADLSDEAARSASAVPRGPISGALR